MSAKVTEAQRERVVGLLRRVALFKGLPGDDLERIAGIVRFRKLAKGELLFREGDAGDRFYVVYSGAVEVLKERPRRGEERLAVKRPGGAFGEMSLLNGARRSASIRALEPTQLLVVEGTRFRELLGGDSIAVRLLRGLAQALRALDVRFVLEAGGDGGGADALRQFGRLVQHGLLPRRVPPVDGYEVAAATIEGADDVGCALWDTIALPGRGTRLATVQVRGAGLPPTYLLAVVRALFRETVRTEPAFEKVLPRLNEAVADNLFADLDECVEVGLLRLEADGVAWCAAGDPPAIVVRDDGELEELQPHGPPLGILPQFDFGTTALRLAPGELAVLVSGTERGVVRGAGELVRQNRTAAPAELLKLLQRALSRVEGGRPERDVVAALVRRT